MQAAQHHCDWYWSFRRADAWIIWLRIPTSQNCPLDRVREGAVPHVMEQRSGPEDRCEVLDRLPISSARARLSKSEQIDRDTRGEMRRSDRVGESRVHGPREDEMEKAVLPDVPEPLEYPSVDDRGFYRAERNVSMDRIPDGARRRRLLGLSVSRSHCAITIPTLGGCASHRRPWGEREQAVDRSGNTTGCDRRRRASHEQPARSSRVCIDGRCAADLGAAFRGGA